MSICSPTPLFITTTSSGPAQDRASHPAPASHHLMGDVCGWTVASWPVGYTRSARKLHVPTDYRNRSNASRLTQYSC